MMKEEFRGMVHRPFTSDDYQIIEKVYMYHPSVSDLDGKKEVACLFDMFGITVFYDMLPRALKCRDIQGRISSLTRKIQELEGERQLLLSSLSSP